jgi:adenosine/AMP kinase
MTWMDNIRSSLRKESEQTKLLVSAMLGISIIVSETQRLRRGIGVISGRPQVRALIEPSEDAIMATSVIQPNLLR